MTAVKPPPDFVVRLGQVVIGREELSNALNASLDRYGQSRHDASIYAQISLSGDASEWRDVAQFLDKMGPRIKSLIDQGAIGSACIDFAVSPGAGTLAKFFIVPAEIAEKAGRHLVDVEVSIYMSGQDDSNVRS